MGLTIVPHPLVPGSCLFHSSRLLFAARRERLAELCRLEMPPPYRPEPGKPVYEVCADDRVAQIAEGELLGPLGMTAKGPVPDGQDPLDRPKSRPRTRVAFQDPDLALPRGLCATG